MWPILSNIDENIANKIKGYKNQHLASELDAWIRVFSGAVSGGQNGLVMESNTNHKLFKAAGESGPTIYGNSEGSGVIGVDWNSAPVETGSGRVLRPSPIITSFTSKEGKDQISREATLGITAFSLEQMQKIQTYFLEPGYSLYIEWGWNTENGISQITTLGGGVEQIVSKIAKKSLNWEDLNNTRKESSGDFDCFLGFIVGGNVSNEGENFNITINLRGAPSLPTYLQSNQGTVKLDKEGKVIENNKVKNLFNTLETEGETTQTKDKRFARMFNDLPAFRQTVQVYNLKNNISGNQFINFDDSISKDVANGLDDGGVFSSNGDTVKVKPNANKGATPATTTTIEINKEDLFSKQRYIRMDLAVKILNEIGSIDRFEIGGKEVSFKIDIHNTVIGAFPYMFSTKADKLVIPGKIPDFWRYFLQSNEVIQGEGGSDGGILTVDGTNYAPQYQADGLVPFVQNGNLKNYGYTERPMYWGYLNNLFVNFDVFKSKIEQQNKNTREIFLDILNEMSSAVNSFWNFQIVEGKFQKSADSNKSLYDAAYKTKREVGDIIITVIDENFIGADPSGGEGRVSFKHSGEGCVFLESNLDMSIPSAMTGQIVMGRLSNAVNPNEPIVKTGNFFSSQRDLFSGILPSSGVAVPESGSKAVADLAADAKAKQENYQKNYLISDYVGNRGGTTSATIYKLDDKGNKVAIGAYSSGPSGVIYTASAGKGEDFKVFLKDKTEKEAAEKAVVDQQSSNMSSFLSKIDVVPNSILMKIGITKEQLTDESKLKDLSWLKTRFCIYTFDDTEYLDRLKRDAQAKKLGKNAVNLYLSPPLPIKYSFKILGNSGIRRGDTFNITGIPTKYSEHGLFQVVQVDHSLQGSQWVTDVTGQYRQYQ